MTAPIVTGGLGQPDGPIVSRGLGLVGSGGSTIRTLAGSAVAVSSASASLAAPQVPGSILVSGGPVAPFVQHRVLVLTGSGRSRSRCHAGLSVVSSLSGRGTAGSVSAGRVGVLASLRASTGALARSGGAVDRLDDGEVLSLVSLLALTQP